MSARRRRLLAAAVVPFAVAGLSADALPRWRALPAPPPMPVPRESGLAPIDGIRMHYAIYGHGAPILLIHGGLGSADVWAAEIPPLAARHEVIVADSRGHGRSTRTGAPLSYALLARDYLALLDYLKVPRVALVGWSDGGIIGLDIAMHHPERLTALFAQGANASLDGLVAHPADTAALAAAGRRDRAEYRRLSPTPEAYPAFHAAVAAMWATEPSYTAGRSRGDPGADGDRDGRPRRGGPPRPRPRHGRRDPGGAAGDPGRGRPFRALQDPAGYAEAVLAFVDATAGTVVR